MTRNPIFDESKPYFAAVAESYDRLMPVISGPSYVAGLAALVDLIPHTQTEPFVFVDLGCGTAPLPAEILAWFASACGIAIDNEPAMLDVASRKLSSYGGRAQVREGDLRSCQVPHCDVVVSSKVFHHISPGDLPVVLGRVAEALRPGGCFLLLDHMAVGPEWGDRIRQGSREAYQKHVSAAIAAGRVTQEELDARWALKQKMKADGKDTEYRHSADDICKAMHEAGFDDVGLVWRMFADTILMGFTPGAADSGAD